MSSYYFLIFYSFSFFPAHSNMLHFMCSVFFHSPPIYSIMHLSRSQTFSFRDQGVLSVAFTRTTFVFHVRGPSLCFFHLSISEKWLMINKEEWSHMTLCQNSRKLAVSEFTWLIYNPGSSSGVTACWRSTAFNSRQLTYMFISHYWQLHCRGLWKCCPC